VDELPDSYALPLNSFNLLVLTISLSVFLYSLTFLIVTFLHEPFVPDIWYLNISEIPWFDLSTSFPIEKADLEHQTVYGDAFRSAHPTPGQQTPNPPPRAPWLTLPRVSRISTTSFTPAWAKEHNAGVTRGLHNPFGAPSFPIRHPTRAITKPTVNGGLNERDDDPFAALIRHDTTATKVPDEYDDKKQTLEPLAGLDSLFRLKTPIPPSDSRGRVQDMVKRNVDTMMARHPNRSSNTTVTTTTVVFSPIDRGSVSSLFPHNVGEEDWNLPLKKPPFRNGRGEGWTTAGATQGGSGKYI
jgi:hypothetical protein